MISSRHYICLVTVLWLTKCKSLHNSSVSCFDKVPDFEAISGYNPGDNTSPNLITYGDTDGDFIQCEKKCKGDRSCYAYTQFFVGDFANSGMCYGRGYGDDILVAVDSAFLAVSGVKVPCRYDAHIEIFDDGDLGPYTTAEGTVLRESANTLPSSSTSSVRVFGPYSWIVYTGENFSGRSLVVTEGFWKYSSLGHIGNDAIRSIKKIDTCSEQPIGCQNFYLVPHSAFSQWQALEERAEPYTARLNAGVIDTIFSHGALEPGKHIPGGWVHYHDTCCDYGIQLDLGGLYRIWSIGTQGTCHCDGDTTLHEAYYVSQFRLSHSVNGVDFNYYTTENNVINFNGNTWADYSTEKQQTFTPSFVASSVRVVTKGGYYCGLRFELYGCAVDIADNQPKLIGTHRVETHMDTTILIDSNPDTCIPLNTMWKNVLKLPTGHLGQWGLNMAVTYSLPSSDCTGYSDVRVVVHAQPPLYLDTQGMYRTCDVIGEELTNEDAVVTYGCSCTYGPCESVLVRARMADNCASICEVIYKI